MRPGTSMSLKLLVCESLYKQIITFCCINGRVHVHFPVVLCCQDKHREHSSYVVVLQLALEPDSRVAGFRVDADAVLLIQHVHVAAEHHPPAQNLYCHNAKDEEAGEGNGDCIEHRPHCLASAE
eukprot:12404_6